MSRTARQLLTSLRRNLSEKTGLRFVTGTTTANGSSDGKTLVDSTLSSYKDDHFNGCVARLMSGTAAGHRQPLVSDFVSSTGTVSLAESFGVQVTSGVSYEIMERGIWDDEQLLGFINGVQDEMTNLLSDGALVRIGKRGTTAGTAGVAPLPSDLVRPITVLVGDQPAGLLHPDEEARFVNDPFLPGTNNRPVALYSGGNLRYRPANNITITWTYIARMPEVSHTQNLDWPDQYADLVVLGATARAFLAGEDFQNANAWRALYIDGIQAINAQFGDNRTKLARQLVEM